MDRLAIPFRTGRTTVGKQRENQEVDSEQGTPTGGRAELLQITVVPPRGGNIQIEAFASDTVLDLKLMLQGRTGHPVGCFRLFYEEMRLQDFRILGEIGICDGCTVYMVQELPPAEISCLKEAPQPQRREETCSII